MADAEPILDGPYDPPMCHWRFADWLSALPTAGAAAGVHVVFVGANGSGQSDTWQP